jgi:hypothetical protein
MLRGGCVLTTCRAGMWCRIPTRNTVTVPVGQASVGLDSACRAGICWLALPIICVRRSIGNDSLPGCGTGLTACNEARRIVRRRG